MNRTQRTIFTLIFFCCAMLAITTSSTAQEPYPIGKIAILVDSRIYSDIQTNLNNYINTLKSVEHMSASDIIVNTQFDMNTAPSVIRAKLRDYYTQNGIEGAILIGDLKRVDFEREVTTLGGEPIYSLGSIDYYYMDVVYDAEPWQDNLVNSPYVSGVFDSYSGDYHAEIWVSRILSRNFTEFRDLSGNLFNPSTTKADEVKVINDYLQRVVTRMTTASPVPPRGFLMGDSGDDAIEDEFDIPIGEYLKLPYYFKIGRPNDKASAFIDLLRTVGDPGYAWAFIVEHSDPTHSNFQQNYDWNTGGTFGSTGRWQTTTPPHYYSYVDMTLDGGAPSQCLFYVTGGCSNVNISEQNCLGQMYAMGHKGLIARGNSHPEWIQNEEPYFSPLSKGATFGQAFLQWINVRDNRLAGGGADISHHLIGAGTLRSREYVPYARQIVIRGATVADLTSRLPVPFGIAGNTSIHASVTCADVNFIPENATYAWTIDGLSYSGNPIVNIPVPATGKGILEVSAPGYVTARREMQLYPPMFIENFLGLAGAVGPSSLHRSKVDGGYINLEGSTSGTGKVCADNSPDDMADNFIYAPLSDNGDDILSTRVDVMPNSDPTDWESTTPGQFGLMIRETDINGVTTPGSPYVCLYFILAPDGSYGRDLYFQYRSSINGHAHRQFIANYSEHWEIELERNGPEIVAAVYPEYAKTIVGSPVTFNPAYSRFMVFSAGKFIGIGSNSCYFAIGFQKKVKGLRFFNTAEEKMRISPGDTGCLFAFGTEQSGSKTGLIFSNIASFTATGDIRRTGSLYNRKWWFDNPSNLTGGLIFRDPQGIPIIHMSTGGTITARNGILPLSQF